MSKPREWWIIQTLLSYTIGEAVYRIQDDEPDELTKRTCVTYFKVVEYAALDEANKRIAELGAEVEELMKVDYWQDRHNIVKAELTQAQARIAELERIGHDCTLDWNEQLDAAEARIAALERTVCESQNDVRIQIGKRTLVEIDRTTAEQRVKELERKIEVFLSYRG